MIRLILMVLRTLQGQRTAMATGYGDPYTDAPPRRRGKTSGGFADPYGGFEDPPRIRRSSMRRFGSKSPRNRRRVPSWVWWGIGVAVVGGIFRKALAWAGISVLAGALSLVGIHIHAPKLEWPWQHVALGQTTTTNISLAPWVLQKIEGISQPALGQANFTFIFTHKVSKNIGPWPCWYAATFSAVGHASATVDLNPGPAWWAPASGHYQLQVLARPAGAKPGRVAVSMVLPKPQLPTSPHQVTIDNIPSHPVNVQHSWTYPGFGCGVLLRPQFNESVLYAQAQEIAYYKATNSPWVTGPLTRAAEREATLMVRDNFIQPTLNAFGYQLTDFTLRWS